MPAEINTLLPDALLLRDQVVPAIAELEAEAGSQAEAITELQAEVLAIQQTLPQAGLVLVTLYLPDLVGLNADSQSFRLPSTYNDYEIINIRANAFKGRDGDVTLDFTIGATPINATPLTITGTSPGGVATASPQSDNVLSGVALTITVGGANTDPGDGNVFLVLQPPAA